MPKESENLHLIISVISQGWFHCYAQYFHLELLLVTRGNKCGVALLNKVCNKFILVSNNAGAFASLNSSFLALMHSWVSATIRDISV